MEVLLIGVSCFNRGEAWTTVIEVMKKLVRQILSRVRYCLDNKGSFNRMLLILHGMNIKIGGVDNSSDSVNYFKMLKFNITVTALTWSESA